MKTFDIFSDFQKKTTLLEASAGTGKTYTITSLFLMLVLKENLGVDQILVVTFTEAAASELKGRIFDRLRDVLKGYEKKEHGNENEIEDFFVKKIVNDFPRGKEKIINAIRAFDLAPVFTIHGFCYRVLIENAFETRNFFDSEIITDEELLIGQSADDFYRKYMKTASSEEAEIIHSMNLYPEYICDLCRNYLKYENITIEADIFDIDISLCLKEFFYAQEKLSALWFEERDNIKNLFFNNESLNKNKYKYSYIESRSQSLDYLFSADRNPPYLFIKEKLNNRNNPFLYFRSSRIKQGTKKNMEPPLHIFFDEGEKFYNLAFETDQNISKFVSQFKKKAIIETGKELGFAKSQFRLLGFNDFITKVKDGLKKEKGMILADILRKRYRAALIDEFQDTDSTQYDIFQKIFAGKVPLFLIGDPKQAIYRFRGADLFAYLKAKKNADFVYTLDKNYRSSPGSVYGVNHIFSFSENPFIYENVAFKKILPAKDESCCVIENNEKTSSVNIVFLKGREAKKYSNAHKFLIEYIKSEISMILKNGSLGLYKLGDKNAAPEDIAVLVRSNKQGREIKKTLEDNNIPCVLASEESVFDSEEAFFLLEFLDCVYNCYNEKKIRWVLTGELFLYQTSFINELIENDNKWSEIVFKFRRFNLDWSEKGIMEMLNNFYYEENILEKQLKLNSGERKVTNLIHLSEILHEEETRAGRSKDSLLKWFADNVYNKNLSSKEYELRLESDRNKVKILTVHKSKGLEFPIVFCGFIQREPMIYNSGASEILYHRKPDYELVLDLKSVKDEKTLDLMKEELLSEDLRLFYVAVTRAKYKTWFFMNESKSGSNYRSPDYILKSSSGDDMGKILDELEKSSGGNIRVEKYDTCENLNSCDFLYKENKHELKVCEFTGEIKNKFKISSFSSLVSSGWIDEKFDSDKKRILQNSVREDSNFGIHGFPKGAFAGIFFHSIFEQLDFQAGDIEIEDIVRLNLESFNYHEKWLKPVSEMVKNVLNKDLLNGFKLCDIENKRKLPEMEFYYPLGEKEISNFLFNLSNSQLNPFFKKMVKKISPGDAAGFMKGFIDLVFEHDGKFYIIDWKSNHLGYSYSDYNPERLESEIAETLYFLQYYIYSCALDKYLGSRLGNNYSYEEKFGGVYYLFIRGISENHDTNGIYYDLPVKFW
ncbi:MAG: exodeoxyribonuclease V subunit beta [Deltaproteobacteria bacterium]|nr:MAG: exodeoxyribonuclease V subunit beta [Deltaproteobacteria bacterium]